VGSGLGQWAGETYISLKMVLELVVFDIRESVMRCGVHLLWQRHGLPMGSFLSAILAGITVSVAEHRFYAQLPPTIAARVRGRRYADDGAVAIREWGGTSSSAEVFAQFEAGCYPKPLELEVEHHAGSFQLLESHIHLCGPALLVVHRLKNWDETNPAGTTKFRVWTGLGSWGAARKSVAIGALLRAYSSCSHGGKGFIPLLMVLRALVEMQTVAGYRWHQLGRLLVYMATRRAAEAVWAVLAQVLRGVDCGRSMWRAYLALKKVTMAAITATVARRAIGFTA